MERLAEKRELLQEEIEAQRVDEEEEKADDEVTHLDKALERLFGKAKAEGGSGKDKEVQFAEDGIEDDDDEDFDQDFDSLAADITMSMSKKKSMNFFKEQGFLGIDDVVENAALDEEEPEDDESDEDDEMTAALIAKFRQGVGGGLASMLLDAKVELGEERRKEEEEEAEKDEGNIIQIRKLWLNGRMPDGLSAEQEEEVEQEAQQHLSELVESMTELETQRQQEEVALSEERVSRQLMERELVRTMEAIQEMSSTFFPGAQQMEPT
eukprot:TRINITY_DN20091_c0_g1_i1.p1 TRINITY_DN20091_c0_g1~~TRINITY_DN20091_c0_g1_i1.p1  ORF type:complete len:267 (-),score=146.44 TRINITY_DN20091_c0_g1_i1:698-1498(-)